MFTVSADTRLGVYTEMISGVLSYRAMRSNLASPLADVELSVENSTVGSVATTGPGVLVASSHAADAYFVVVWEYMPDIRTVLPILGGSHVGHAAAAGGDFVAVAGFEPAVGATFVFVYQRQYTQMRTIVDNPTKVALKADGISVTEDGPVVRAIAISGPYVACIFKFRDTLRQNVINMVSGQLFDNAFELGGVSDVSSLLWSSDVMVTTAKLKNSTDGALFYARTDLAYLTQRQDDTAPLICSPTVVNGTRLVTGTSRVMVLCVRDAVEDVHRYQILQPPINTRMLFDLTWGSPDGSSRPVLETVPPLSSFQRLHIVSQPSRTLIAISTNVSLSFFELRLAANASVNYQLVFTLASSELPARSSKCAQCHPYMYFNNLNAEFLCSSGPDAPATLASQCVANDARSSTRVSALDLQYPAAGCCLENGTLRTLKTRSFFNLLGSQTTVRLQATVS